jgi:glutaredoxin
MHDKRRVKIHHLSRLILISIISFICMISIQPGSAVIFLQNGSKISGYQIPEYILTKIENPSDSPALEFFYSTRCRSCQDSLDYLRALERKNPGVQITYFNLAWPEENRQLFTQYKSRFNTTKISYPAVFYGEMAISGSSDIVHYSGLLSGRQA